MSVFLGIMPIVLVIGIILFPVFICVSLLKNIKSTDKIDGHNHKCPYCGALFYDARMFHTHIFTYLVFKCPECGRIFTEPY